MGGGGGGTFSGGKTPEKVQQKVRDAEQRSVNAAFDAEINEKLGKLLSAYNDRDAELVQTRLNDIKDALQEALEETVDTVFGGSVAKHTYVDGLSDVDTLAILNRTDLAGADPQKALRALERIVKNELAKDIEIEKGKIALTLKYPDGMQIQMLPAIHVEEGIRVPAWAKNEWSTIDPEKFHNGLTKRNQQCAGKLVPTIKLVKAINMSLPEGVQLSGYYIESLAIAAFRDYGQACTPSRMLQHFFEQAQELVLNPMTEKTGQSVRVDDYLGAANSQQRQKISQVLSRISKRIRNANASMSIDQWLELFAL